MERIEASLHVFLHLAFGVPEEREIKRQFGETCRACCRRVRPWICDEPSGAIRVNGLDLPGFAVDVVEAGRWENRWPAPPP